VLFFVGLVLSVIAVIVLVWGVSRAIQDFGAMADDAQPVEGTATVAMEADDIRFILAPQDTDPACSVTGPSGTDVPVESDSPIEDAAASGEGITVVGAFTATEAGEHTVTCDTAAQLSPALDIGDAVGIGAAGLAFLSLFPLGFLTLLGLVLWLVGRNRDKKAALGPGGYGYSTSSGYGAAEAGYGNQGYGTSDQGYGTSDQGYGPSDQGYGTPPPPGVSTGRPGGSPYGAPPPPGNDPAQGAGDEDRDTERP
jgi:hypothetical protein